MRLTGKVLNTVEFYHGDRLCTLEMTRAMVTQAGAQASESDGIVDFTMYNDRVQIGMLFKEAGDAVTKVSLRSNNGAAGINVSDLATRYGGGGHANAAGCTINRPLAEVKAEFVKIVGEILDGR
jgi:phosphoesterase RecJ-like protein